jgi:hypothetical protein
MATIAQPAATAPDPALLHGLRLPAAASLLVISLPFLVLGWNQRAHTLAVIFLAVLAFLFLWPYGVVLFRAVRGNAAGAASLGLQTSAPAALWTGVLFIPILIGSWRMVSQGSWREFFVDSLPILIYLALLLASQISLLLRARQLQRALKPGISMRAHAGGLAIMSIYVTGMLLAAGMLIPSMLRPPRLRINQTSAVGSLRAIRLAAEDYAATYKNGFPPSLAALGPPGKGASANAAPSCAFAELIDPLLATARKDGYRFVYQPGPPVKQPAPGCPPGLETYTLTARPVEFGVTGARSFYLDSGGIIHFTAEDRPATSTDPSIN